MLARPLHVASFALLALASSVHAAKFSDCVINAMSQSAYKGYTPCGELENCENACQEGTMNVWNMWFLVQRFCTPRDFETVMSANCLTPFQIEPQYYYEEYEDYY